MRVYRDLRYDNKSEKQTLDLYLPSGLKGPYPLIIYIHGGAWEFGDKNDGHEDDWKGLVNEGYALASINYRLIDEANYPESLLDCKRALDYLKKHAEQFDLDLDKVAVVGSSAGGYFALMLASTVNNPKFKINDEDEMDIKSCIAWYAPTDFTTAKSLIRNSLMNQIKYGVAIKVMEKFFGDKINNIPDELLEEASPVKYINQKMPQILIQQGNNDFVCPPELADIFLKEANKKGVDNRVTVEVFDGAGHVDPMFSTWENKLHLRRFLEKTLSGVPYSEEEVD